MNAFLFLRLIQNSWPYAFKWYEVDNKNNNNNRIKAIILAENFFQIVEIWMQMPRLRSLALSCSHELQSTNNITNQHSTPNIPHTALLLFSTEWVRENERQRLAVDC